jgi:hypothetical protein
MRMIVKGPDGDGRHGDGGKKGSLPWHVSASKPGFSPPSGAIMGGAATSSVGQADRRRAGDGEDNGRSPSSAHMMAPLPRESHSPSQYASCSAYSGANSK